MKLYIVRHGETLSNKKGVVVSANDQLASEGIEQAKILAQLFSNILIDLILTSPQDRAKKTAEIVAEKINKKVVTNDILREKKWPSEIEGKPLEDSSVQSVFDLLRENNLRNQEWHHSDEENFLDTKKRAAAFLRYLYNVPHTNVLAVSHEYFMKTILAVMMYNEKLSYELFRDFFRFTTIQNTSVTLCEKDEKGWHLITLNNKQHLG